MTREKSEVVVGGFNLLSKETKKTVECRYNNWNYSFRLVTSSLHTKYSNTINSTGTGDTSIVYTTYIILYIALFCSWYSLQLSKHPEYSYV